MDLIKYSIENSICTIRMNREKKYNSFVREMAIALQDSLDEAEKNDDVRCIILTGTGKAFSAGQDLIEATQATGDGLKRIVEEYYNPLARKLRNIEKPIIAAVNGVAAGAGANIALACDIVLAKESASFIQAFCHIGLVPDSGGTWTLPRLVGLQRATALMMTGKKVKAAEAEEMGMIYQMIPDDKFDSEVEKLATTLANLPTKGLGLIKLALNHSMNQDLDSQLELERALQFEASQTKDYKEGVAAFLEKRKPKFIGK